jgi:hypothetical protein
MQSHGILDMQAWLKLNCSITFVKRARPKVFSLFENVKIAPSQTEI